ncbi:MAG: hypothetical protein Q8P05_00675 [Candidatus Diapherotrites archaeon]|nr:hypothetical protein [Candidatus Diapherotrites archaeon]
MNRIMALATVALFLGVMLAGVAIAQPTTSFHVSGFAKTSYADKRDICFPDVAGCPCLDGPGTFCRKHTYPIVGVCAEDQ